MKIVCLALVAITCVPLPTDATAVTSASVVLTPSTYKAGTTPTTIKFTFNPQTAIPGDGTFTITCTEDLFENVGNLTAQITANGSTDDVVFEATSKKVVMGTLGKNDTIAVDQVVTVTLEANGNQFAALPAAGTVTTFSFETSVDTALPNVAGWTTVDANATTTTVNAGHRSISSVWLAVVIAGAGATSVAIAH